MPDHRRTICVCCGAHRDTVGELSWTGLCVTCGPALLEENARGIASGAGFAHKRRLRGMARYLERALIDDAPTSA
jgi:hypothetical protein